MNRNYNLEKTETSQFSNSNQQNNFQNIHNNNFFDGNNRVSNSNSEYFPKSENRNFNSNMLQQEMGSYYFDNNNNNSNFINKQQQKFSDNRPNYSQNFNMYSQSNNFNTKPYSSQNIQNQSEQFSQESNTNQMEEDEFKLIQSLQYVAEKYKPLVEMNDGNKGISLSVKNQFLPRFFVIKSFTEEDIHKSIKYGCWSSTKEGNKKLNSYYDDSRMKGSDVFLFFSMNGSGRFVGVARMASNVDFTTAFEYWAMDEIWRGLMKVEWLFIKDIPNKLLKDIKLSNNAFKPVSNSRDTQEIPRIEGEQLLELFENISYQTNILQHFQYYDERQGLFEKARNVQKDF